MNKNLITLFLTLGLSALSLQAAGVFAIENNSGHSVEAKIIKRTGGFLGFGGKEEVRVRYEVATGETKKQTSEAGDSELTIVDTTFGISATAPLKSGTYVWTPTKKLMFRQPGKVSADVVGKVTTFKK